MLKWLSLITLLALALGIIAGAAAAASGNAGLVELATQVGHIGDLWLNLLRMTVIPLVVSLLIVGVASVASAASTGRLAARSIFVFGVLLVSATAFACVVFPLALTLWPVHANACIRLHRPRRRKRGQRRRSAHDWRMAGCARSQQSHRRAADCGAGAGCTAADPGRARIRRPSGRG